MIFCPRQNVASREWQAHQGAESLACAVPILCPAQLSQAARSQWTGQAGTPLRVNLSPVLFHLLRHNLLHTGWLLPDSCPGSQEEAVKDLKQVKSWPLVRHKEKSLGQRHPAAPVKEGWWAWPSFQPGVHLLSNASLPHSFSTYLPLLYSPIPAPSSCGTWRHIVGV